MTPQGLGHYCGCIEVRVDEVAGRWVRETTVKRHTAQSQIPLTAADRVNNTMLVTGNVAPVFRFALIAATAVVVTDHW